MVEHARGPRGDRMTGSALRRSRGETCRDVIRNIPANRGGAGVRGGVAAIAVCRTQRVIIVGVALRARRREMRAHERKARGAVVKGRRGVPPRGGVAVGTIGCCESGAGRRVHRIISALPGSEVTLRIAAIGRGDHQRVVPVDVALRALHVGVAVGQREARCAVIEFSVRPLGDRMTTGAGGGRAWKSRGDVIRDTAAQRGGALPSSLMASQAIRGSQRIVIVDVALRARRREVRPDEREAGDPVVERRTVPASGCVAIRAICRRERRTGRRMHWRGGLLPSGEVATGSSASVGSNLQIVIIAEVAGGAGHVGVALRQREACGGVVEGRGVPARGVVAVAAVLQSERRARAAVRRVIGLLPGAQVAAGSPASRRRNLQIVVVVDVAGEARNIGVACRKQKPGGTVIELGV